MITMSDYMTVLADYDFTHDDDERRFASPGGQTVVTVTDPEGSFTVTALDATGAITWAAHLVGAPVAVFEAALRAAEPTLSTVTEGE